MAGRHRGCRPPQRSTPPRRPPGAARTPVRPRPRSCPAAWARSSGS